MIPAIFTTLKSADSDEMINTDVIIVNFIVKADHTHAVALNPNNQQFFDAPLPLFKAKMQEESRIAVPSDVA